MSAITLLGVSTEIYTYGTLFVIINLSYGIATAISAWYYLPVFYKLQATSAYEVNKLYAFVLCVCAVEIVCESN